MALAILENQEPVIGLAQVAKVHKVHTATVTRWIQSGARGAMGNRIRLEAVRKGYKWLVSEAALKRFFERLSEVEPLADHGQPHPADRRRAVAAADLECRLAGA